MRACFTLVRHLRPCLVGAAAVILLGACAPASRTSPGVVDAGGTPASAPLPRLTPTVPPADLDAIKRFAWQQVTGLGDAFAAGDADAFLAKVSRGFYRGYTTLETSLRQLLAGARARTAVVAVSEVAEEEGRVSVRAEWTRSVTRPDGSTDGRHGQTVFLFLKSDTSLRLLDYRGDAPFGIDGI